MRFVLLTVLSCLCLAGISQRSDFIVLRKHHKVVKNYLPGVNIGLQTADGYYQGLITAVKKDSIFMNQYDVRQLQTNLGVYIVDTVAVYRLAFHYRDIKKIEAGRKKGFNWAASGGSLFGGGVLLTTIGLGTWLFTKPGTQYHAGTGLVVGSAALAGLGYLLMRSAHSWYVIGKGYLIDYIKVK